MRMTHFYKGFFLVLVLLVLGACRLLPKALSNTTSAEEMPTVVVSTQEPDNAATPEQATDAVTTEPEVEATSAVEWPDPLDNLLALRSIQFNLSSIRSDDSRRAITGEIDAVGNMHLKYELPVRGIENLTETENLSNFVSSYEIYVIDGQAYAPSEDDPAWVSTPVDADYLTVLSEQLHGLDGFTTWLDMLPTGSIQASGSETQGGFAADKYTVSGIVSEQTISGMLWYDTASHALIKAELHVPSALNSDPANPASGEFVITLNAEQAEIAPVTLPVE